MNAIDKLTEARDAADAYAHDYGVDGKPAEQFGEIANMLTDALEAIQREAGEPVMEVHKNSAGQISLRTPNGDAWDMSKHVGLTFYKGIEDE